MWPGGERDAVEDEAVSDRRRALARVEAGVDDGGDSVDGDAHAAVRRPHPADDVERISVIGGERERGARRLVLGERASVGRRRGVAHRAARERIGAVVPWHEHRDDLPRARVVHGIDGPHLDFPASSRKRERGALGGGARGTGRRAVRS